MSYRYRPLYRYPSFDTLPSGLEWDYVEIPAAYNRPDLPRSKHPFGVIYTVRPLTDEELRHFGLVRSV